MKIKEQLTKLKENWLIIVLVLFLLFFLSGGNFISLDSLGGGVMSSIESKAIMAESYADRSYYPPSPGGTDFAPDVEERKIVKTTSLSTEVERGTFKESESKLNNIVTSSDSFLLNQNVHKYGTKRKAYFKGSYQIKVSTNKYDSVVSQLKDIGEVQSFNENMNDVTGTYTNTEIEIEIEKSRLKRYEDMYEEAEEIKDKIDLNDRIFNQERRIKYLEDSLKNIDQRVDYSTISFSMNEKRSEYANIVFVKISSLIQSFVESFNSLIWLVFVLAPWAIAALIAKFVWKVIKKKK